MFHLKDWLTPFVYYNCAHSSKVSREKGWVENLSGRCDYTGVTGGVAMITTEDRVVSIMLDVVAADDRKRSPNELLADTLTRMRGLGLDLFFSADRPFRQVLHEMAAAGYIRIEPDGSTIAIFKGPGAVPSSS